MEDIFEDLFDGPSASEALADISTAEGRTLSELVYAHQKVKDALEANKEEKTKLNEEKQRLEMKAIPDIMTQMNMTDTTVKGGYKVSVTPFCRARLPVNEDKREKALAWLRENNEGGIIKNELIVSLDKGKDNLVGDVIGILKDKGFDAVVKSHVHHSTLDATVIRRESAGKNTGLDLFNGFLTQQAKIGRV